VARFDRLFPVFFALIVLGLVALIAKQVIVIAEHGVAGWLRGDGGFQTEWEVRAVILVLAIILPAAVVVALVRLGEAIARRLRERGWERAARRARERR
jgi:uncharacterized membrane protein